ncbi:Rz1-like lysis system protein LysC [Vreelandella lionensis]|uniref:Rz1-like lysis system protein LysC n=1 Tax=Vreelandella lionensis TaxID=1144478 RepID=UPI001A9E8CD3|nr:Rz1-like lysis system protein LysC [Halomonas lionensis]
MTRLIAALAILGLVLLVTWALWQRTNAAEARADLAEQQLTESQQREQESLVVIDALWENARRLEAQRRALDKQQAALTRTASNRQATIEELQRKTPHFALGLALACLLLLSGCAAAPPSPVPMLTINQCATPSPCSLPASNPHTNGELHLQLERTEAAWAQCAAEVDAIIHCQSEAPHDQPTITTPPPAERRARAKAQPRATSHLRE